MPRWLRPGGEGATGFITAGPCRPVLVHRVAEISAENRAHAESFFSITEDEAVFLGIQRVRGGPLPERKCTSLAHG